MHINIRFMLFSFSDNPICHLSSFYYMIIITSLAYIIPNLHFYIYLFLFTP